MFSVADYFNFPLQLRDKVNYIIGYINMGSPEKPINVNVQDVEMGDMSEEARLKQNDSDNKPDHKLLPKNGEVEEKRFTGLKKEELLAISNQPKWVRARWALFILFWIIWVAMLVGAVLIVVNAPRCKPEPEQQWYQDNVAYEVDAKQFNKGYEGMLQRLPYIIGELKSKIVLLTGVDGDQLDGKNEEDFNKLINEIHNKEGKVMIDVIVDSLQSTSAVFKASANANCVSGSSTNDFCNLFIWRDNGTMTNMKGWKYSDSRKEFYQVSSYDDSRAVLNYSSNGAFSFIEDVISGWFNRSIDGVKVRDLSLLQNINENVFIAKIWNDLFESNETSRALYVYSSTPNASNNPVALANRSNTMKYPIFLTSEIIKFVSKSDAGESIKQTIVNWREQSRAVTGFVVSPYNESLAARREPKFAAGLNLLSMALPGVPILRSGDELAATSSVFSWDEKNIIPLNGSSEVFDQTQALIASRVAGIQTLQSLRYDSRNNDTVFVFLDTKTTDVIAFKRKWDKKKEVLIVSNLSPNNHSVNLMVENGLMSDDKLAENAEVLVNSIPEIKFEDTIVLKNIKMVSGLTLVLVAKN